MPTTTALLSPQLQLQPQPLLPRPPPTTALLKVDLSAMAPHILIAGTGIAGPVLACLLARSNRWSVTLLERAPRPRTTGQQVDVRGAALDAVKLMGLEDEVRARTVKEQGMAVIDSNGKRKAAFAAQEGVRGAGFTSEVEILRGELAGVFLEAAAKEENVEVVFGDWVVGCEEDRGEGRGGGRVKVQLAKGGEKEFDVVVAADGMNSSTRKLMFPEVEQPLYSLEQHMAFFTIPLADTDTPWATWYNAPNRRLILVRPDLDRQRTGAYFGICNSDAPKGYEKLDVPAQKKIWAELFRDAGGEAERIIEGMLAADDFYMQEIAQVRMDRWFKGRCALLGDAAYCPTPISGMGTTLAIVGAYVMAGELLKHRDDHPAALQAYEEKMRPMVAKVQKLAPGAPQLANPQTWWGISLMNGFLAVISATGLANWFQGMATAEKVELPQYDM